ncbi:MAG: binding-protein-dependent transport system inner rane component [Thermomicrobiales bacterium]|nr:binding-protein-dependent transport system inner rane component [Thermomicrobiales bacterium]
MATIATQLQEQTGAADSAAPDRGQGKGTVVLRGVTKRFEGIAAVDHVDLTVPGGSYVVLLGPSGCGKTTLLRMLGGHATIDEGEFLLDGVRTNDVPPARRDISTVFQHYGLFPHKSVRDNVEFGLKMRGLPRDARRRRAEEALAFLDLTSMADRRPRQLSGGQQQRVALARALVTEPTVLLLDEPLGDLDRLLQLRMRVELRALQRRLRITFIHVTHNQEEALAIADQIVVMQDGRIQQVGRPQDVYTRPANLFTSGFMGDNNVVPGQVSAIGDGQVWVEGDGLKLLARHDGAGVAVGQTLHASVRASSVSAEPALWSGSPRMSSSSSRSATADAGAARPGSVSRLRLAAGSAWALLLAFPIAWLLAFLIIPVVVVLVVSFFEPTLSGFNRVFTLDNYRLLADSDVFIRTLGNTVLNAVITTVVTFLLGFWVAYYLALVVPDLRRKFALFIIALAPFFTSFLIRAIAWIPMMGREGLLNTALLDLGITSQPLDFLLFSDFAVRVAMIQLYLLFMVSPIFFSLSTIEPAILESARDSGAGWWAILREILLPLARPGIVIGAVFVFVLSMGEFATVRLIGGGKTSSVGLGIQNFVTYIQFPQAAAAASILVLVTVAGVAVLFRYGRVAEGL